MYHVYDVFIIRMAEIISDLFMIDISNGTVDVAAWTESIVMDTSVRPHINTLDVVME